MKKLKRDPEQFDVLELFSDMAAKHGYDLNDPVAQDDFGNRIRSSIEKSKKNNVSIFGKRTEAAFAYVVGALGKASLLKQEDSGDIYFTGNDILAPDYRLTFEDGEQLLVEVKNYHQKRPDKKFSIKKSYYQKLKRYAELNGLDIQFALYFSAWNLWTLLSINSFEENDGSYEIDLCRAMKGSEMSRLGDCMVGTAPDLELHLLADADEASEIDESGLAPFIARDVKLFCAGKEIVDEQEKKIAFHFIQFGTWVEKETEAITEGTKLTGMKLVYTPESQEEPNFAVIGHLSTMVTNAFKARTAKKGIVRFPQ